MYYVGFSTATIVASLILFQGFNTTDGTNTVSLIAGFVVIFLGVHLLNISRQPEAILPQNGHHGTLDSGLMNPRMSLQGRASLDGWNGLPLPATPLSNAGRRGSLTRGIGHGHTRSTSSQRLFSAFEEEELDLQAGPAEVVGLQQLREEEEDEDEDADERTHLNRSGAGARPVLGRVGSVGNGGKRSHSHSPANGSPHPT